MSLKIEGKKCPICRGYLFDDDEIVWCPECGAPHHKDCYKTIGRCGFFELHGTQELKDMLKPEEENQKQEEKTAENGQPHVMKVRCNSCGAAYPIDYERCPDCSAENKAKNGNFFMFDMLGGVSKSEDIGEGVTAEKAGRFVAVSPHRYIPKFKAFKYGKKRSFSLWTFLFPTANFASRKMYSASFLCGIVEIASTLLMTPLAAEMSKMGITKYQEIYTFMMEQAATNKDFMTLYYLGLAGAALIFLCKLIASLVFDKVYYKHVISKVKQIEAEATDKEEAQLAIRKYGGLNIFSFIIAIMLLQYVPSIIASLIL